VASNLWGFGISERTVRFHGHDKIFSLSPLVLVVSHRTVQGEMTVSCTTHNLSNAQGLWLAVLAFKYERSEEWILRSRKRGEALAVYQ
jgi:hypothetical protein